MKNECSGSGTRLRIENGDGIYMWAPTSANHRQNRRAYLARIKKNIFVHIVYVRVDTYMNMTAVALNKVKSNYRVA